jgi:hypothetical protein
LEWKMSIYFVTIRNILRPFGIVCGHLVYVSRFGMFGPRKIWQPWSAPRFPWDFSSVLLRALVFFDGLWFASVARLHCDTYILVPRDENKKWKNFLCRSCFIVTPLPPPQRILEQTYYLIEFTYVLSYMHMYKYVW